MSKYLRPHRGTKSNAYNQNILLKRGEIFLEFPNSDIGKGPGRIIIGDGDTSYQSLSYNTTATNKFRPFITDPEIFIPRFTNTDPTTIGYDYTTAISKIGDGSSSSTTTLPAIISAIKEALCKLADAVTDLKTTKSHVGMIIHSTTLDTEAKVIAVYGGTKWIQHTGYVLRGASTGVVANSAAKTAGSDSVSYTPTGSNSGMGVTMNAVTLTHSGGAVQSHTLTINQIPAHNHGVTYANNLWVQNTGYGQVTAASSTGANKANIAKPLTINNSGGGQGHNHGFTQPNQHSFTPSAKSYTQPKFTGTAATINTLPQYKSVYIWERTQ